MIERHWHWEFMAYDAENADDPTVHWGVRVEVIGFLSEADARVAAQYIVARQHHRLIRVWECAACGFQQATSDAMTQMSKAGN